MKHLPTKRCGLSVSLAILWATASALGAGCGSGAGTVGGPDGGEPTPLTPDAGEAGVSPAEDSGQPPATGEGCTAGRTPITTLPQKSGELSNLVLGADGTLAATVHQTVGDTLYLLTRPAGGAWKRDDVTAPQSGIGFGIFGWTAFDEKDRVHIVFASRNSGVNAVWHGVRNGMTWTHQQINSSVQSSPILGTRLVHHAGASYAVFSQGSIRAVRVGDDGVVGALESLPDSVDHSLVDLVVDAQGTQSVLTFKGQGLDGTIHVYRRVTGGTWTDSPVTTTGIWGLNLVPQADGGLLLLYQSVANNTLSDLMAARFLVNQPLQAITTIDKAATTQMRDITSADLPGGGMRLVYTRDHYQASLVEVVLADRDSMGKVTLKTLTADVPGAGRRATALDGTTVHRLDCPLEATVYQRTICL